MKKLIVAFMLIIYFSSLIAACMTMAQVQAETSKCLYVVSGKVYWYGTYPSKHHGHTCGTDVTSVLPSGHSGYLSSNYYTDICTSCTPTTCAAQGKNCGSMSDGCSGTLNCGTCTSPQTCGGGGTANVCGCTATTYNPALNTFCGSKSVLDNCGVTSTKTGTLTCTSPQTCGGGGTVNVCGCTATTYNPALNTFCGSKSVVDNCGTTSTKTGTLTCTSPQTCGGGGTANVCGCTATTYNPALNTFCGSKSVLDNCGVTSTQMGTLTCTSPQTCGGGGVQNTCGCTPNCAGKNCGDNSCGGTCGACSSGYTCQISNGTCMKICTPTTEVCDGLDNNCNGQIDEGFDKGTSCSIGIGQCFSTGVKVCAANQTATVCNATVKTPIAEICGDGLDNNCNGQIDDGCQCQINQTQVCGSNIGECRKGTQTCQNGNWSTCIGEVKPTTEICDGKDNDCDGQTDEGFDKGVSCSVGLGECFSTGVKVCAANQTATVCNATLKIPTTEICDGKDNNCNGQIDEGFDKGISCSIGVGECFSTGIKICAANATATVCNATLKIPTTEICDGKDNNCNGQIDEGFDKGISCSIGVGECFSAGIKACSASFTTTFCNATVKNSTIEICDNKDNDCDGLIDENLTNCSTSPNCIRAWNCTNWSACLNNSQSRACTDNNNCTINVSAIELVRVCTVSILNNTNITNVTNNTNSTNSTLNASNNTNSTTNTSVNNGNGNSNNNNNNGNSNYYSNTTYNQSVSGNNQQNSNNSNFQLNLPEEFMWMVGRVSGMLAYLFLALSILGAIYRIRYHKYLSYTAFVLVVIHLISLLNDNYMWGSSMHLTNSIFPSFTSATRIYISLGTIASYLMIVGIIGCWFFKKMIKSIGFKSWLWIHRLSLIAFILVYLHASKIGTDFSKTFYHVIAYLFFAAFIIGYFIRLYKKMITEHENQEVKKEQKNKEVKKEKVNQIQITKDEEEDEEPAEEPAIYLDEDSMPFQNTPKKRVQEKVHYQEQQQQKNKQKRFSKTGRKDDMDDVLKRLKEMGK